jgi:hypothetical protein
LLGGSEGVPLARLLVELAVLAGLNRRGGVVLGREPRTLGPPLLARDRDVHHLAGGLDGIDLLLDLLGA